MSRTRWPMGLGLFSARPKLASAAGIGLAVGLACFWFAPNLAPTSCFIGGWDAFCLVYLALVLRAVAGKAPDDIRARAAVEDQGKAVILGLIVAACAASVVGVAVELTLARPEHGVAKGWHVAVAVATVAASWLLMQVVYALHYAHEYYAADPQTGADLGGLAFPGEADPNYWDFLHFSVVIGVAAQTADVAFTDRRLRGLGTTHSLLAFLFNTLILALTINLVAGLF
ncbi:DUF1345 domain-containing protein [uncultured Phenylobacterium sp.]|uniref:DUF1345 domain-containing protein n=1 Tax=uncultured Phenylobacterium sp. TaxID=349273 RepID=UPI0025F83036|nr:DUF1345 domain-containing protein [uncultured Phenylobacterium sp.]